MELHNNDGHKPKAPVHVQPNIGLDSDVRIAVVEILNKTLADEAFLAQKTRSAHWNMRGAGFLELHSLYETQYQLLNTIADDIAERARMLGGNAIGSLLEFINFTRLEDQPGQVHDILVLLADHETLIRFLRDDARKCTEEYEDEGTFELLVSILRLHEKIAWMLRSYIEPQMPREEGRSLPGISRQISYKASPDGQKATKRYQ
jgi:starvation-inducible DNA-binding protein